MIKFRFPRNKASKCLRLTGDEIDGALHRFENFQIDEYVTTMERTKKCNLTDEQLCEVRYLAHSLYKSEGRFTLDSLLTAAKERLPDFPAMLNNG